MIHMAPDRVLLPIVVIDECADIVGDDLVELGLPVLQLLLSLLFHPMRVVAHAYVPFVQGVPPDERYYFLLCLCCFCFYCGGGG